jgi:hypothetical protein
MSLANRAREAAEQRRRAQEEMKREYESPPYARYESQARALCGSVRMFTRIGVGEAGSAGAGMALGCLGLVLLILIVLVVAVYVGLRRAPVLTLSRLWVPLPLLSRGRLRPYFLTLRREPRF